MRELRVGKSSVVISTFNDRQNHQRYLSEIAKYKPLTVHEEVEAFVMIAQGHTEYIDKIYRHNLLFVVSVAKKYGHYITNTAITLEDLIAEGNVGLHKAIVKFDHTKGFKLITYAVWYIREKILTFINNNYRCFRIPSHINSTLININKKICELEQVEHRRIGHSEIVNHFSEDQLKLALGIGFKDVPVVTTYNDDNKGVSLQDVCVSEDPNPEQVYIMNERKMLVRRMLKSVPEHIARYINDYYGLDGQMPLNYQELAVKYDGRAETIRTRIEKYLKYLKRSNDLENDIISPKRQIITTKIVNDQIVEKITYKETLRPKFENINGRQYEVEYLI